ncbi:MAG: hypothetical protein J5654_10210, partial [Victivallales bacterium]|nr:hypothetical protein [Victivallales bacterium]
KRTPVGLGGPAPVAAETADADTDNDEAPAVEPEEPEEAEEVVDENAPATEVREIKDHYRRTNRGTQGVTSIKLMPGDQVVAAMQVEPDTTLDLLMLSMLGQAVRIPVAQVRRTGRNCKGVKVMKFSKDKDAIANVSLVDKLSEEDEAANAAKDAAEERSADRAAAFQEKLSAEQAALDAQAAEEERLRQEALENGDE